MSWIGYWLSAIGYAGELQASPLLRLRDNASLVLRISARSADLKKELSLLKQVHGRVSVPTVVADDFSGAHPFALIEFIEGTLFSDALRSLTTEDLIKLAAEAGTVLQAIHSFDLGKAGFFDENFAFSPVFENFGGSLYEYICSNLASGQVRERLGVRLAERTLQCVQSKRQIYSSIPNSTRLIHCDYNLKNILIRKIGSALRFEDELPPGFSEAFVRGYVSGSIGLPSNWREVAGFLI
jgi:aminoglycoside phosphotransferase (APT) family kinase protein